MSKIKNYIMETYENIEDAIADGWDSAEVMESI